VPTNQTITFELDEYHRNTPESEILADIQRAASELGKNSISRSEYSRSGKFSYSTVTRRFGSWSAAIARAEMNLVPRKSISDEMLIEDILSVAAVLGKRSVGSEEYAELGKFTEGTVRRRFGTWPNALAAAKLEPTVPLRISDEDLFLNLEEVWRKLGRQPSSKEIHRPLSKFAETTYKKRFGAWRKALEAFVSFINTDGCGEDEEAIESQAVSTDKSASTTAALAENIALWKGRELQTVDVRAIRAERGPRNPGRRLIMQVLFRDNGICQVCKRTFTEGGPDYHIDHIFPWIKGGPTILSNLQLLCSKCNLLKGALDLTSGSEIEVQNVNS